MVPTSAELVLAPALTLAFVRTTHGPPWAHGAAAAGGFCLKALERQRQHGMRMNHLNTSQLPYEEPELE
jgi:hypothetical protein